MSSPPHAAVRADGKALQGDAASARLKEQGHHESLMQAVQAARYAVETVKPVPDTAPGGECYAGNPAQALRCWFRADGLELQPAGANQSPWKLNLRLQGYGRATLAAADVDGVRARQNRVELSRANGAVVAWYENRAAGLEQGFTVQRPPPGADGPLRLALEAEGDLRPQLEAAAAQTSLTPALSHRMGEGARRAGARRSTASRGPGRRPTPAGTSFLAARRSRSGTRRRRPLLALPTSRWSSQTRRARWWRLRRQPRTCATAR